MRSKNILFECRKNSKHVGAILAYPDLQGASKTAKTAQDTSWWPPNASKHASSLARLCSANTLVFLKCLVQFAHRYFATVTPRGGSCMSISILHNEVATWVLLCVVFAMFFAL